jgi:hypothetical protein
MGTLSRCVRGTLLLGAVCFTNPSRAFADERPNGGTPAASEPSKNDRFAFSAAYFGELMLHPGVLFGVEYRLAPSVSTVTPRTRLLLAGNLGGYVHVRNHVGALADAELGVRHGFGSGPFVDAFAGLGYLHTVLAAPVYEVSDDGRVSRVSDFGRPAFMPVISLGTGYETRTLAAFLRVETFGQYPFNRHLLPHAALLLGLRFSSAGVSL